MKQNKKRKLIVGIAIIIVIVILAIVITNVIMKSKTITNGEYSVGIANADSSVIANYIKKGITIGGITGTLESLDTSDATATPEDISYGKTAYVKGEKITGTRVTKENLEIGQYVNYVPDDSTSYTLSRDISGYYNKSSPQSIAQYKDLKWRIMSINEDGIVELVSDNTNDKGQKIWLKGAEGYNNGVYILNDIAEKLYSNKSLGTTARSMTIEDIEKKINEVGITARDAYTSSDSVKYGETKTFTKYKEYPEIYAEENGSGIDLATTNDPNSEVKKDGIGGSEKESKNFPVPNTEKISKEASKALTVRQTYYYMTKEEMANYFDEENKKFYELIFDTSGGYWLASRFVSLRLRDTSVDAAYFGLHHANSDGLNDYNFFMFSSFGASYEKCNGLRAVVSLSSGVKFTGGDGSEEKPWNLEI